MMKSKTFTVSLIVFGLLLLCFTVFVQPETIIKPSISLKDYKSFPVNVTQTGFIYYMDIEIEKKSLSFSKNDFTGYISKTTKENINMSIDKKILYEDKNIIVFRYILHTEFFTGSFDFVPTVKSFSYPKYAWYHSGWDFKRKITINHTQVAGDLVNFPVCINLSSDVNLSNNAQADGNDIFFVNGNENFKYNHEIEYYNSGSLVAWVNITSLSASVDTIIWMYYGNSTCGSQENVAGTWDSDYYGVWHFSETGTGTRYDSTDNNDLSPTFDGTMDIDGICDGADDYDGDSDVIDNTLSNGFSSDSASFMIWFKADSLASDGGTKKPNIFEFWKSKSGIEDCFYLSVNSNTGNKQIWSSFYDENGNYCAILDGGFVPSTNTWYHCFSSYNNSDNTGRLFINGNLKDSDTTSIGTMKGNDLEVSDYYDADRFLDGIIDEFRISTAPRDNNWAVTCYNSMNNATDGKFFTLSSTYDNVCPTVTNPQPTNNSINNELTFTWNVTIQDDRTNFNWSIKCSHGETNSQNNDTNGTKSLNIVGLDYSTEYTIYVNVSEWEWRTNNKGCNVNFWFNFTTKNPDTKIIYPNATGFNIVNHSINISICLNSFSAYLYDDNGDKIYYTIELYDNHSIRWINISSSCFNNTVFLNFSDCLFLGWNYTIWFNITDDNATFRNYYLVFRTESCCFNLGGNMEISIDAQQLGLFLTLVLFLYFFYVGYTNEKNTGGFLMFVSGFIFLALDSLIGVYVTNTLATFLLGFMGLFIIVIGLLKWLYYDEEENKIMFRNKRKT